MCIPLDRVCNGKNDCGNWADEPKDFCEVNECSQSLIHDTKQPLCDQQCIDLPIGYKCACKEGYELVGNSTCKGKDVKNQVYLAGSVAVVAQIMLCVQVTFW